MASAKITVSGEVQMVGFRYYSLRAARRLGIRGYVRNLPTGQVEIAASGNEDDLEEFIGAVKEGPPSARVTDVKIDRSEGPGGGFSEFSIIH